MKSMQNENFSTRDIYLSAVLLSLKFSLTNISMQIEGMRNQPIGYFSFENTKELAEVERKYWARKIAIEPIEFIDNLYKLKSEVTKSFNKRARIDASQRDIHFAATLITLKFDLLDIEFNKEGYRRQLIGRFIFEESPQLEKAKEDYLAGRLAIEPILFVSNLRGLKSQLANIYKSPHTNMEKFEKI